MVLRTRIKDQKKEKVHPTGHHWGGIPYGYTVLDGKLVVDPDELKIVRKILIQWQKVKNFSAIAHWLNGKGILSKRGKKWNGNSVASILRTNIKE